MAPPPPPSGKGRRLQGKEGGTSAGAGAFIHLNDDSSIENDNSSLESDDLSLKMMILPLKNDNFGATRCVGMHLPRGLRDERRRARYYIKMMILQ